MMNKKRIFACLMKQKKRIFAGLMKQKKKNIRWLAMN